MLPKIKEVDCCVNCKHCVIRSHCDDPTDYFCGYKRDLSVLSIWEESNTICDNILSTLKSRAEFDNLPDRTKFIYKVHQKKMEESFTKEEYHNKHSRLPDGHYICKYYKRRLKWKR